MTDNGVSEGTRTLDPLDHNQMLYQLSYTHHGPTTEIVEPSQSTVSAVAPSTARAAACASSLDGPGIATKSVCR
jgi:hypothetical protein